MAANFGRERASKIVENGYLDAFETPQNLARSLFKEKEAEKAMQSIRHVRDPLSFWLGELSEIEERVDDVLYVYQQAHLDTDFQTMKRMLSLPEAASLPRDTRDAHRLVGAFDTKLDPLETENLRRWYANDYEIIKLCERLFESSGRMRSLPASPTSA